MFKRLVYIACLGICLPFLVAAGRIHGPSGPRHKHFAIHFDTELLTAVADTTPKKQQDDKKKIKEVSKAKQVPKPEKLDDKVKKRQRRPPGLERPPEIPRHNGG